MERKTVGTDRLAGRRTGGSWCLEVGWAFRRAGRWEGGRMGGWAEGIVPAAPAAREEGPLRCRPLHSVALKDPGAVWEFFFGVQP